MKIYVASSLQNWKRVREFSAKLRAAGHTITFDWTPFGEQRFGDGSAPPVYIRDRSRLSSVGIQETRGVMTADALVLLANGGFGTYFEFGLAYGIGLPVIILGFDEDVDQSRPPVAFHYLPRVNVVTTEDAVVERLAELPVR